MHTAYIGEDTSILGTRNVCWKKHKTTGWWFETVFCIQFDEHIFQTGWFNHQLEKAVCLNKKRNKKPHGNPKNLVVEYCKNLPLEFLEKKHVKQHSQIPYNIRKEFGRFPRGIC